MWKVPLQVWDTWKRSRRPSLSTCHTQTHTEQCGISSFLLQTRNPDINWNTVRPQLLPPCNDSSDVDERNWCVCISCLFTCLSCVCVCVYAWPLLLACVPACCMCEIASLSSADLLTLFISFYTWPPMIKACSEGRCALSLPLWLCENCFFEWLI